MSPYTPFYTVKKVENGFEFTTVIYDSRKNKTKPLIIFRNTRSISEKQWDNFKKVLEKSCFWNMPIIDTNRVETLDGGTSYFDGFIPNADNCTNKEYHIVSRGSGSKADLQRIIDNFLKYEPTYKLDPLK